MPISAVAVEIMKSYFLMSYRLVSICSSCKNNHFLRNGYALTHTHTHTHTVNRHKMVATHPHPFTPNPTTIDSIHTTTDNQTNLKQSISLQPNYTTHIYKNKGKCTHLHKRKGAKVFLCTKGFPYFSVL